MVKKIFQQIGVKNFIVLLLILIILSGIGAIIFERAILPQLSTWPVLKKLKLLDTRAPIVITQREEIRITEQVNTQEVARKVKGALVRVYEGEPAPDKLGVSVPGLFVTSDGLIIAPNQVFKAAAKFTAMDSSGKFYPAQFLAADDIFGLAFFKIEAENASVINHGLSLEKESGERLLAASLKSAEVLAVQVAGLKSRPAVSDPGKILDAAHPNFLLELDEAFGPEYLGTVLTDSDGALIGFATRAGVVRSEDLHLSIDMFLSNGKKVFWPRLQANYSIWDQAWSERFGGGGRHGVYLKSAAGALAAGDFILEIDGRSISAADSFQQMLLSKKPGQKVKFTLLRKGQEMEVDVAL